MLFSHTCLSFSSLPFILVSFLFYFIFFPELGSSWKGFSALAGLPTLKAAIPWAYPLNFQFLLYIHLIIFAVFLVSLLVSFPCVFFFPLGTFPVFCLRSTPRLPHPVCPLGELGPLSHMAPGIAACNTHINNDFITAVNYGTQCAD